MRVKESINVWVESRESFRDFSLNLIDAYFHYAVFDELLTLLGQHLRANPEEVKLLD